MRFKLPRIQTLFALSFLLFLLLAGAADAAVSANIPLESRVYRDLEYLEARGFVKSSMLSTRPFTWTESMRLLHEAKARWASLGNNGRKRDRRAGAAIRRLSAALERATDYGYERSSGAGGVVSFRPFRFYSKYLYSEGAPSFAGRNNNGDAFEEGSNLRAGFDAELRLLGAASIYLNPEYRLGKSGARTELVRGYALAEAGNLQIEAGRDSMWWGAGQNAGLLMTNNAAPLEMIKLTSARPFILPWFFRRAGLVKPTVFLARLGEQRAYPRANLLGMRLDFKPTPHFQFGVSRTFVFGGEGKRSPTLGEWIKVFAAADSAEHSGSPINGNQLASIDASLVYPFDSPMMPLSGIKLYTEWGAEDSGGRTRTPTGRANIYGLFVTGPLWINGADLRVEWANTGRNERYGPEWYEHAIYSTGYRHEGRVIGLHAGGDARDLFVRLQYHTTGAVTLGFEYERIEKGIHSASPTAREWYEVDLEWTLGDALSADGFLGRERVAGVESFVAGLSLLLDW
ncbi:MAG: hypothetical protein BMS9Abin24_058 [Thermodesulfobacteriota bacterium]|nr:MAG: hypothetical protein BMS9Abin24_058 [Thermodesulfobacteriota bacterium]